MRTPFAVLMVLVCQCLLAGGTALAQEPMATDGSVRPEFPGFLDAIPQQGAETKPAGANTESKDIETGTIPAPAVAPATNDQNGARLQPAQATNEPAAPAQQAPAQQTAPSNGATQAPPATTTTSTSPATPAGAPAATSQPADGNNPPAANTEQQAPANANGDAAVAPAQPAPLTFSLPAKIDAKIKKTVETLDNVEKLLSDVETADTNLGRLRDQIDHVINETTKVADSLRPKLADVKRQIEKLGPLPAEGEPAESASALAERERLNVEATALSGAIKTLEVSWWRARQAIDKITDLRLRMFVRSLTERQSSPLLPDMWLNLWRVLPSVWWRVQYNIEDFAKSVARKGGSVAILLVFAFGLFALLKMATWRFIRFRPTHADGTQPTFFDRAASAAWAAPAWAIPSAATTSLIYGGLDYLGLLYYPTAGPVGASILRASLLFIAVSSLLAAVFAPRNPDRRLVQLSDRSALRVCRLLQTLTALYSIDLFFTELGQVLYFPLGISVVQSLVTSLSFAFVMTALLLTRFEPDSNALKPTVDRWYPRTLKVPLLFAIVAIIAVCLFGYVALGRFLSQQILMTGVIALIAILLYLAIRAYTRETGSPTMLGGFLENRVGMDDARRRQLAWIVEFLLTGAVGLMAVALLALQWGFTPADVRTWMTTLLFGFEIGSFRISLVRILIGIGLFVGLLFVTRFIQRRLRDNVLTQPRMDPGIANSIDTAVGYLGIALAALIAISYAGFDITSLAIVAGALGVGIGFGLQSIVNNFVSGLILLIERPIKVGDWIVVGADQGNVKRISVRSTEIETFDRASLIIPNAELIAGRVLNKTHRNALGRVELFLNAGPDEDPDKILAILEKVVDAHPDVLREPAPLCLFHAYTATATEFRLFAYLPDVTKSVRVQSQLRSEIFKAFRAENIEMPITTSFKMATPAAIVPD